VKSPRSIASINGFTGSSRGALRTGAFRGGGVAEPSAWHTVRRCTRYRRASSRTPTSSRLASRRIASNSSTLDDPIPARVMPGNLRQVGPLQAVTAPGVSAGGARSGRYGLPANRPPVEPEQTVRVGPEQADIPTQATPSTALPHPADASALTDPCTPQLIYQRCCDKPWSPRVARRSGFRRRQHRVVTPAQPTTKASSTPLESPMTGTTDIPQVLPPPPSRKPRIDDSAHTSNLPAIRLTAVQAISTIFKLNGGVRSIVCMSVAI
jgi:hypothetical protein